MTRDDLRKADDLAHSCAGLTSSAMLAHKEGRTDSLAYVLKLARAQYAELGKALDALEAPVMPEPDKINEYHGEL